MAFVVIPSNGARRHFEDLGSFCRADEVIHTANSIHFEKENEIKISATGSDKTRSGNVSSARIIGIRLFFA
jgi:hypothetical protein